MGLWYCFEGWKTKVKYTTAVLGQNESCGTSIAEESKILLVLFRALKGGKTWFLAREIRLCGLDYRSDVAFFAGILCPGAGA